MNSPLFTQKHYERLAAELHARKAKEDVVEVLCDIFARDNPKFKPELFREQAKRRVQ